MIFTLLNTWPETLLSFLESNREMLLAHALHQKKTRDDYLKNLSTPNHISMPPNPFDSKRRDASLAVVEVLRPIEMRGWQCTRLTDYEIADITKNGMRLPNLARLRERIEQIYASGLIDAKVKDRLIANNDADDQRRRDILWFCFSPPCLAGQGDIEGFFRNWGGEALFGTNKHDSETGKVLQTIGSPCLIEADVPLSACSGTICMGDHVIRQYLSIHGFEKQVFYEDKSHHMIPSRNIVRIISRDDKDFSELTGCDEWSPTL